MKRLLFVVLSILTIETYAQAWLSKLPQNKSIDSLTFYEYQRAFNAIGIRLTLKEDILSMQMVISKKLRDGNCLKDGSIIGKVV